MVVEVECRTRRENELMGMERKSVRESMLGFLLFASVCVKKKRDLFIWMGQFEFESRRLDRTRLNRTCCCRCSLSQIKK